MSEATPSIPAAASGTPQVPAAQGAPAANRRNALSSDVEIKGSISFNSDLYFDGKLEGDVTSSGSLTLGDNAFVNGEILTESVVIRGVVKGNVTVEDRCELRGEAELIGDLKASRLVMEENATLVGKSEVTPNKNKAAAASPSSGSGGGFARPFEAVRRAISGN